MGPWSGWRKPGSAWRRRGGWRSSRGRASPSPPASPTFRDAEGLWKNFNPLDYATPEAYARDPEKVWAWYAWRIQKVREAKPNPAHYALVELERRILSRGEASSSSPRTWTAFTPSREARTWWSSTATSSGPGARPAGSGFPCRRPSPRPLLPGLRPPGPARCGLVRGVSAGRGLGEGGKGLRRGRLRLGGGHQRRGGARGLLGPDRLRLGGLPGGGEPRAHPLTPWPTSPCGRGRWRGWRYSSLLPRKTRRKGTSLRPRSSPMRFFR